MANFNWPINPTTVTSGPVQFVLDGVNVEVTENTTTPADSLPLPVKILDGSGVEVDLATEAKQDDQIVQLAAIQTATEATQTSTAAINAKVATEAKQDAQIVQETAIKVATESINTKVATETTLATRASEATLATRASEATLATRASETTLAAASAKLPATLGQTTMAASLAVTLASNQSTLPVSVASLPLPSGAATETTLAAINTKTPALGQAAMAASVPVVLASNQSAIPVSQTSVVSTANSTATPLGANLVFTGTSELVKDFATAEVSVYSSHVSAALGLSIQQSSDGTNWDLVDAYTIPAVTGKTFSVGITASYFRVVLTNGPVLQTALRLQTVYHYNAPKPSNHSLAETITNQNDASLNIVQIRGSDGTNAVPVLVSGTGIVSTNVATIGGVATTSGNGTSTGALRVVLATDTSSNTNPLLTKPSGRTVNHRIRYDYSSVAVTTAAYTQILSTTTLTTGRIEIFDSSGQTLVLATGAPGSEVDLIYIMPGGNGFVDLTINSGVRLSVKAVSATANVGEFTANLYF